MLAFSQVLFKQGLWSFHNNNLCWALQVYTSFSYLDSFQSQESFNPFTAIMASDDVLRKSGSCMSVGCVTFCFNSRFSCTPNWSKVFEGTLLGQQNFCESLFLEEVFTNCTNAWAGRGLKEQLLPRLCAPPLHRESFKACVHVFDVPCWSTITIIHVTVAACECNPIGSVATKCDLDSGQCECRSNYGSRDCSACADGYFGYPNCECEWSNSLMPCPVFFFF